MFIVYSFYTLTEELEFPRKIYFIWLKVYSGNMITLGQDVGNYVLCRVELFLKNVVSLKFGRLYNLLNTQNLHTRVTDHFPLNLL